MADAKRERIEEVRLRTSDFAIRASLVRAEGHVSRAGLWIVVRMKPTSTAADLEDE
jgi:hypothetical protein